MRKVLQFVALFALAVATRTTYAQIDAFQNWCQDGGVKVLTSGLPSSTTVQASYPQCKVDVYLTGTLTRATIFKDKLGTALTNPFTAFQDGYWLFFAADGQGYDVVMSLGTPNAFPTPKTLTDLIIGAGGGGGGGTVFSFSSGNLAPLFTTSVTNPTTNPVLNFSLLNAANMTFLGNVSGSTGPPSYINFVAGANVTLTPSGGNTLTIAATGGGGGGGCGPLAGDATSTDCGNNNLSTPTGTTQQAFGYNNLNVSPANETVTVGDSNANNLPNTFPTPADIIGIGNDNLDTMSGQISDMVCLGDQNCRFMSWLQDSVGIGNSNLWHNAGANNTTFLSEAVAIGISNVQYINDGDTVIGIGQANAGGLTPGGSTGVTEVIAMGDSSAFTVGNHVDDVIAIGAAAASYVSSNSGDIIAFGDGTLKQCQPDNLSCTPQLITSFHDVVAIGDGVGQWSAGSDIVAIGDCALSPCTNFIPVPWHNTGSFLVAIGTHTLGANSTGNNNVGVGAFAGCDGWIGDGTIGHCNQTGSNNTWIGYDSGPNTATQLSNTVALGYQAHNTQSNQTVIGNSSITQLVAFGTGDGCLSSTSGVITGSGSACGSGGGGGSNVTVNGGSTLTTANFNGATPAAGANNINVTWQVSAPGISAEVPYATSGAFGVVKPDNSTITISGGVISAVGSGGPTIRTNGTLNTSQALLNFVNPGNFNGLSFTFSNPSGGIETFAVGGTLGNAGLTNSSITINGTSCTLGGTCTVSGGGAVSSVANSDGTLTISPTTGTVVASLALGHANTWSATQTFSNVTLSGITGSTQCLQVNTSGVVSGTGSVCGSGGSTAWSALTNPSTNLALTMGSNTTTFTFGATTGSADLFKWTDTASNTGTGILGHFTTAASSTEIPWQADANGLGWRVATDGSLRGVGSSATHGMVIPEATPISGVALSDVVTADLTTHRLLENPNNTGAVILSGTTAARTPGDCVAWAANGFDLVSAGGACGISGGGSAFSAITTGANTTATMTLGTGSSMGTTGTGTNQATIVASEESVSFSTTPTFSTSARESTITLTASITSFTLASGLAGQEKTLTFCENSTGGFDVTPPANVHGFMTLSGGTETASKCNSQHFTYNSIQTAWIADSPGVLNQ